MLIKLIYLVRTELALTKQNPCPLSRGISFLDRTGIIEVGSKGSEAGLKHLVVANQTAKMKYRKFFDLHKSELTKRNKEVKFRNR